MRADGRPGLNLRLRQLHSLLFCLHSNIQESVTENACRLEILQTIDGHSGQGLRFVELALFVVVSADADTYKNILF